MMPLMMFLLQSEDSKKQADRIIAEVKTNGIKDFSPTKDAEKKFNDMMLIWTDLTNSITKLREDLNKLYEKLPEKRESFVTTS